MLSGLTVAGAARPTLGANAQSSPDLVHAESVDAGVARTVVDVFCNAGRKQQNVYAVLTGG